MGTGLIFWHSRLNSMGDGVLVCPKKSTVPLFLGLLLWLTPISAGAAATVTVTLQPQVATPTTETVSFGLPLPPGLLTDSALVAVFDGGTELPAYVEALVPWRGNGRTGIRSVLIQVSLAFSSSTPKIVTVALGTARQQSLSTKTPIVDTLLEPTGVQGPRVLALLPAEWLANSWVAGPQVPASQNTGEWKGYEQWIEKYFEDIPGSSYPGVKNYNLTDFEPWLYDRVTTLYKIYVRTGHAKYLQEAYRSANLYRQNIYTASDCSPTPYNYPCIGVFKIKEPNPNNSWMDAKYSYTESPAIHYMLTGDDRFLQTIRDVTVTWDRHGMNPAYQPGQSFTERHIAFGFMGYLHAYEILGRSQDLTKLQNYANAIFNLQSNPPDGFPADGCWRHYSSDHGEGGYTVGCSPWMSSLMTDAFFKYYLLTNDIRAVNAIAKFVNWLDKYGLSKQPYYAANDSHATLPCYFTTDPALAGRTGVYGGQEVVLQWGCLDSGAETAHNMQMTYMFAMGYWASGRTNQQYLDRMRELFPVFLGQRGTNPPRLYNWALRESSTFLHVLLSGTPIPSGVTVPPVATIPRPTVSFSASPTSITAGQFTTLSWSAPSASVCISDTKIEPTTGSMAVSAPYTINYSLTCSNAAGNTTKTLTIFVGDAPSPIPPAPDPVVALSASPSSIAAGQSATLTWSSTHATACSASWDLHTAISGSANVTPAARTAYTITCTGLNGFKSASATAIVTVTAASPGAPTVSLSASPSLVASGQPSTLTWSSTNAASCTASGGWSGSQSTSGSQAVSPTSTTTYTLTCTGAGGSASQSVTVTVAPPAGVRGDFTGDGQVTLADLRQLIYMFIGRVPIDLATADLTGDGTLTLADLRALVGILVGRGG